VSWRELECVRPVSWRELECVRPVSWREQECVRPVSWRELECVRPVSWREPNPWRFEFPLRIFLYDQIISVYVIKPVDA